MSTQTKKFADRAKIKYQQISHRYSKSMYMASESELEGFVELIIKECVGIYEAIDNGNKIEGTDNYILALRRRFEL